MTTRVQRMNYPYGMVQSKVNRHYMSSNYGQLTPKAVTNSRTTCLFLSGDQTVAFVLDSLVKAHLFGEVTCKWSATPREFESTLKLLICTTSSLLSLRSNLMSSTNLAV